MRRLLKKLFGRKAEAPIVTHQTSQARHERDVVVGHPNPPERFLVQRNYEGKIYVAYHGSDGTKASEAWDGYKSAHLPGVFTFDDTHHTGHRGWFSR